MRRMLLLVCAVALCGSLAVVAFASGPPPVAEEPRGELPAGVAAPPATGPFAVASQRAQAEADAERHRAAYAASERSSSNRYGSYRLIRRIADRLDVPRQTMWRAVTSVRTRMAPRRWSDARDEALEMLAHELDRPVAEVQRAVRTELRRRWRPRTFYDYEGPR